MSINGLSIIGILIISISGVVFACFGQAETLSRGLSGLVLWSLTMIILLQLIQTIKTSSTWPKIKKLLR